MDLEGLRAFLKVAEHGSFSRAADSLHLAQPAVSQQIKRLERDLGCQVFERSTRRVGLTAAGEALLPRARAILAELARATDDVRLVGSGQAGRVSVGFVGTATYSLLPRVVRSVRQRLPAVELEVFGEELTPDLVVALTEHRLDAAVVRDPAPHPDLVIRSLRAEPLIAALPADHPAAGGTTVELAALREAVFVTHPAGRSVTFEAVMRACRDAGFVPSEIVEVRETATLVAFVAAGIGVALVPEPVQSLALEGVAYLPLADVAQRTDLAVAHGSREQPPAVMRVIELIEAEAASRPGGEDHRR